MERNLCSDKRESVCASQGPNDSETVRRHVFARTERLVDILGAKKAKESVVRNVETEEKI